MPRSRSEPRTEHVDIASLVPPFAPNDPTERWLFELHRRGIRPGLTGIRRLLKALGSPELRVPSVVVAGTNGKGTMAICLAALCRSAGLRTAIYTSPHLLRVAERMVVDDQPITPRQLLELVDPHRPLIDQLQTTFFESLTALAMLHFAARRVDVAILEAGLGGRLDATNAVPKLGVVLTSIGLDHHELLGDSLEAIAEEKLGLAQADAPFYLCPLPEHLRTLAIARVQAAGGHPIDLAGRPDGLTGDGVGGLTAFAGPLQRGQVPAALTVYRDLAQRYGWPAADPARALAGLRAPARYERYGVTPELIVDTAHNEPALTSLLEHWSARGDRDARVLVLGVMRDKLVDPSLPHAIAAAGHIVVTAPRWYRAAPPQDVGARLRQIASEAGATVQITVEPSVRRALEIARDRAAPRSGRVLVTGSNFLVAEALDRLGVDDLRETPGSNAWSAGRPLRRRGLSAAAS